MDKKATKITATATYKSGRVEAFSAELNRSGEPPKKFQDRCAAYRSLPTVVKLETVKS